MFHLSRYLLLQTATPDSVCRIKNTVLSNQENDIYDIYFNKQHHSSMQSFMSYCLDEMDSKQGLLIQVR